MNRRALLTGIVGVGAVAAVGAAPAGKPAPVLAGGGKKPHPGWDYFDTYCPFCRKRTHVRVRNGRNS